MTDPARHAESRNALESLMRSLPGFRGYLEREYRRESDEIARRWIAGELQKCKSRLDDYQRTLLGAGQLDLLPACERLRGRLDLLQSRIQGAMRGYSGFFDFVRVDEEVLDQVYQLDRGLMDVTRTLLLTAESLGHESSGQAGGTAADRLRDLQDRVDELSRHFDQRGEILAGMN